LPSDFSEPNVKGFPCSVCCKKGNLELGRDEVLWMEINELMSQIQLSLQSLYRYRFELIINSTLRLEFQHRSVFYNAMANEQSSISTHCVVDSSPNLVVLDNSIEHYLKLESLQYIY